MERLFFDILQIVSIESRNNLWLKLSEAHLNFHGRCSIAFSSHTRYNLSCIRPLVLWSCFLHVVQYSSMEHSYNTAGQVLEGSFLMRCDGCVVKVNIACLDDSLSRVLSFTHSLQFHFNERVESTVGQYHIELKCIKSHFKTQTKQAITNQYQRFKFDVYAQILQEPEFTKSIL